MANPPDRERWLASVLVVLALVLFGLLWLVIDSNMLSSVHGAP